MNEEHRNKAFQVDDGRPLTGRELEEWIAELECDRDDARALARQYRWDLRRLVSDGTWIKDYICDEKQYDWLKGWDKEGK